MQSALGPTQGQQTSNQSAAKTRSDDGVQDVGRRKLGTGIVCKRREENRDNANGKSSTNDSQSLNAMTDSAEPALPATLTAVPEISTATLPIDKPESSCDSSADSEITTSHAQLDNSQKRVDFVATSNVDLGKPLSSSLTEDAGKELVRPEASRDDSRDMSLSQSAAANTGGSSNFDLGEPSIQASLMEDASTRANQAEILTTELSTTQSAGTVKLPSSASSNFVQRKPGALSAAQDPFTSDNTDAQGDSSQPISPDSIKPVVDAQFSNGISQSLTQSARQKAGSTHAIASGKTTNSKVPNFNADASSRASVKEKSGNEPSKAKSEPRQLDERMDSIAEVASNVSGKDESSVSPAVFQESASLSGVGSRPAVETGKDHLPLDVARAQALAEASTTDTVPTTHSVGSVQTARLVQSLAESQLRVGLQAGEFGKIDIHTSMHQNQISARIYVEHEDLGKVLAGSLPELHEKLEVHHRLDAQVELYNTGSDQSDKQQHEQYKPTTQNFQIDTSEPEPQVDTPQHVPSAAATAGLDMHV